MIVIYAEKEDMGIKFAAALGGISYNGNLITMAKLSSCASDIKKMANKQGYLQTSYNGFEYVVTWGWGHFGTLKHAHDYNPDYKLWSKMPLPFLPTKYEIKRVTNPNDYFRNRDDRQFKIVESLFNSDKCEYIINATDYEREGELIYSYLYQLCNCKKPYTRVKFNKQTEQEIRKAFTSLIPSKDVKSREDAGRCRAVADWAIGINLTAAATLNLSPDRNVLSVGRVITPTLNLIVEREKEILGFSTAKFYSVEGTFINNSGESYTGKHPEQKMESEENAIRVISSLPPTGTIETFDKEQKKSYAPKPYSLSALQKAANAKYGFTAKETLDIAQKLYEGGSDGGYITYPRTDSEYITSDMKAEMEGLIKKLGTLQQYKSYVNCAPLPIRVPGVYFDDSKVDGHPAILTTEVIPSEKDLDENQRKIYDLIAKSVIRLAYPPLIVESATLETEVGNTLFKTTGSTVIDPGWSIVDAEKKVENNLPKTIDIGDVVSCSFKVTEGKTEPPKRYTDASLLDAMEKCGKKMEDVEIKKVLTKIKGIGRPSTRDSIIEKLLQYKYVTRTKKVLQPTPLGMQLMEKLNLPELKSPELTAKWEMELDEIEKGNLKPVPFIREIENQTRKWCEEIRKSKSISAKPADEVSKWKCPKCGKLLNSLKYGYKCTDECGFTLNAIISEKKLKDSEIQDLLTKKRTGYIKGFKSKDGNTYGAYLVLNKDFKVGKTIESLYRCPVCEKPLTPKEWGYGCMGYKEGCEFSVPNKLAGRNISAKELHDLITTGTTGILDGFISKKNPEKKYRAELTFDENGKVIMVLPNRKENTV